MTLTTVVTGFGAVAVLFVASRRLGGTRALERGRALPLVVEALVLTLLAALWFGSLGRGGWPLVFGLIAVLRFAFLRSWTWSELASIGLGVGRYLLAGLLLAWLIA